MSGPLSLAVVVPMYNEAEGAEECVDRVSAALDGLGHRSALVVVDDGSTDGTAQVLKRIGADRPRLVPIGHAQNRGYGAALRTGVEEAARGGYDYVLFMDSDLTNDPRLIPDFVARMEEGYDVIKASRYVKGGGVVGVPAWKRTISWLGNRVAHRLLALPIRDCTNGYRALRTTLLTRMTLSEPRFPVIMEELYQAKYLARSFVEIPNTLTLRAGARRPSSFSFGPRALWRYLKYPLLAALGRRPRALLD
jgi:glycosyltransferase involved in cell wall biosynthesis